MTVTYVNEGKAKNHQTHRHATTVICTQQVQEVL